MTVSEVKASLCFNGPSWLILATEEWPNIENLEIKPELEHEILSDYRGPQISFVPAMLNTKKDPLQVYARGIDPRNHYRYCKLIRLTALMLRFIKKARTRSTEGGRMKSNYFHTANVMWEKAIQKPVS